MPCPTVGSSCPNEYQLRNFGLIHNNPADFVESQMGGASVPYVVYRVGVAIYFCAMTAYSVLTFPDHAKWLVYLSHWSYVVITLSTVLQAICAVRHYHICKEHGFDKECERMQLRFKVIWVLQNIMYSSAPLVTIFFWSLFYRGGGVSLSTWNTHVANIVYWTLEVCVSAVPVRFLHFHHFVVYGLTYVLFTVIYWRAGGTGVGGEPYVYGMLDYGNRPLLAAAWVGGFAVLGALLHFSVYTLVYLRESVCRRYRRYNMLVTISDVYNDHV